jgi:DNA-binding CsgD family transcriptional regulator
MTDTQMLRLSPQQTKTMNLLADGLSNKEIARALDICEGTVKLHVKDILYRMRVRNRTRAAIMWREMGRGMPALLMEKDDATRLGQNLSALETWLEGIRLLHPGTPLPWLPDLREIKERLLDYGHVPKSS